MNLEIKNWATDQPNAKFTAICKSKFHFKLYIALSNNTFILS